MAAGEAQLLRLALDAVELGALLLEQALAPAAARLVAVAHPDAQVAAFGESPLLLIKMPRSRPSSL